MSEGRRIFVLVSDNGAGEHIEGFTTSEDAAKEWAASPVWGATYYEADRIDDVRAAIAASPRKG